MGFQQSFSLHCSSDMVHGDNVTIDTNLVEDKYKTGTGEVLRLWQKKKKSRLKQRQTSHMVLLAAQHWLVGSDKYRLQHSQMNIIACSCHDGEKGRKVVSLWKCGQTLRAHFQVSGYSWIRLMEYQWVIRSRIFFFFCPSLSTSPVPVLYLSSTKFVSIVTLSPCTMSDEQWSEKLYWKPNSVWCLKF